MKIEVKKKYKLGAAPTVRRFVVSEAYSGEKKLSELLTELLCREYGKREENNNK